MEDPQTQGAGSPPKKTWRIDGPMMVKYTTSREQFGQSVELSAAFQIDIEDGANRKQAYLQAQDALAGMVNKAADQQIEAVVKALPDDVRAQHMVKGVTSASGGQAQSAAPTGPDFSKSKPDRCRKCDAAVLLIFKGKGVAPEIYEPDQSGTLHFTKCPARAGNQGGGR